MQCTCECVAIDTCAVETFAVKATTRWFHAEDWVDSAIQVIFGSTPEDKELPKSLAKDMLVHLAKFVLHNPNLFYRLQNRVLEKQDCL